MDPEERDPKVRGEAVERAPRTRSTDHLLVAIVPLVVLLMAAIGTWRYHRLDQTSWRGGTLGMFATIDSPSNRLVRGVMADGTIVLVPTQLEQDASRALVTPTERNLERLANSWQRAEPSSDLVLVEVYRTVFDPSGPTIRLDLIRAHPVDGQL